MSAPDPHRPWTPPAAADKRKLKPLQVAALSLLALAVLCCGGVGVVGAVVEDDKPGGDGVAVEQTAAPRLAAPLNSAPADAAYPSPSPSSPSPSPSARPAKTSTTGTPAPRKTTTRPKPKPTTKKPTPKPKPTTKAPGKTVTPGAFCSPEGAAGLSKKGKAYRCTKKTGEKQARWRPV